MMTTARSRVWYAPLLVVAASVALAAPEQTADPQAASLSPSETMAQAKEYQGKMQDTQREIVLLQEQAKKSKDIVRLNCVNDKLEQVRGHLAVGDQAMRNLNEAIAKGDDGARQQEYTRTTILYQKVLVLGTEAKNCIGEDLTFVGALEVKVIEDPSIPKEDVTAFANPNVDTTRPPVASSP